MTPKLRKPDPRTTPLHDSRSFGSGLDKVGREPNSEPRRLKPRLENTIEQVRIEFENALITVVADWRFGGGPVLLPTELEMLEEATRLVKEALTDRKRHIRDG